MAKVEKLIGKANHYNQHPSGIEIVHIKRFAGGIYGDAIKYLARYKHKGTPRQDLEKARDYLKVFNEEDAYRLKLAGCTYEDYYLLETMLEHEDAGTPLWFALTALEQIFTADERYNNTIGLAIKEIEAEMKKYPEVIRVHLRAKLPGFLKPLALQLAKKAQ